MTSPPAGAIDLYARVEGSGDPLLLLHGLGADHVVWNAMLGPLSKSHRVIAPDLRGHGRSPSVPSSTYTFEEMEADLSSLLAREGVEAAHVVGLSAGGFLALWLAIHLPARVRSLVVIGSAAKCDGHTRAVAQNWAQTYREEGFEAYFLRLVKDLYYPDWAEAHLDLLHALRKEESSRSFDGAFKWGTAVAQFDVRNQLGRIAVPTLVIHGMDDQVIDASHARTVRQAIPGAALRLFPRTGHLVPVERPEESVEAIRDWRRTTQGGPPSAGPAP